MILRRSDKVDATIKFQLFNKFYPFFCRDLFGEPHGGWREDEVGRILVLNYFRSYLLGNHHARHNAFPIRKKLDQGQVAVNFMCSLIQPMFHFHFVIQKK